MNSFVATVMDQDSLRPFPWTRVMPDVKVNSRSTNAHGEVLDMGSETGRLCDDMEFIDYKLPPENATAGRILHHAKSIVDKLFAKHSPMIFKIGYTHNPSFRWSNTLYGYKFSRDKCSNMVVLFGSAEVHGPAFLEASLIDAYKCIWLWNWSM